MEDQKAENILDLKPTNLKDILLYSLNFNNIEVTIKVPPSRFRKILSDYYTRNGITIDGMIDRYAEMYAFYKLSELDNNGNIFKIVKEREAKEYYGRCQNCTCTNVKRKRWVDSETGQCYYNEMIQNNYTTKIQ